MRSIQSLYLFPRECPRILIWPTPNTALADLEPWFAGQAHRMIAFVERAWIVQLSTTVLYRYELPAYPFEDLDDAGMWVCRSAVEPSAVDELSDFPERLREQGVGLRVVDTLIPLKPLWHTSLHVSGLRLRNAEGWGSPGRWGRPEANGPDGL